MPAVCCYPPKDVITSWRRPLSFTAQMGWFTGQTNHVKSSGALMPEKVQC